jgi:hypothetical protein
MRSMLQGVKSTTQNYYLGLMEVRWSFKPEQNTTTRLAVTNCSLKSELFQYCSSRYMVVAVDSVTGSLTDFTAVAG